MHVCKLYLLSRVTAGLSGSSKLVSDIAVFVLKRDVKLQLTNYGNLDPPEDYRRTFTGWTPILLPNQNNESSAGFLQTHD